MRSTIFPRYLKALSIRISRKLTKQYNISELLFLALILVTGTILRFVLLPTTHWYGDPARDLIVSRHIIKYNEIPKIGQAASGTNPMFFYPPIYYFLLAFIQIPSTNTWYVYSVYILFSVTTISTLYYIAKRLSGPWSAAVAVILYTFSSFYLEIHTTLNSDNFALPFFLLGTLFHLKGIQKNKSLDVFIGLFFLALASSIFYAAMILLPIYMLWTIVAFHNKPKKIAYFFIFTCAILGILFFRFFQYFLISGKGNILIPLSPYNNISVSTDLFIHLYYQYRLFLSTIFPFYTSLFMIFIPIAIIVFLIRMRKFFSILYLLSFVFFTLLLCALKNKPVEAYYYLLVAPFVFIIIGLITRYRIKRSPALLFSVFLVLLASWSSMRGNEYFFLRKNTYREIEQVAMEIMSELKALQRQNHYQNLHFARLTVLNEKNEADWDGLNYAFFMENEAGKIFKVTDKIEGALTVTNNLDWTTTDDYYVLICLLGSTTTLPWCLLNFNYEHPNYTYIRQIQTTSPFPIVLYKKNGKSL